MHENLCFSIQSPSPNLDDLPHAVRRVRDGFVCGRIILGSVSDRFRIVNGVLPEFRVFAVGRILL